MLMLPVNSSNIAAIGHDASEALMHVQFTSGSVYEYESVSADEHAELLAAPSVGSHFAKHFKRNPLHPFRQVA